MRKFIRVFGRADGDPADEKYTCFISTDAIECVAPVCGKFAKTRIRTRHVSFIAEEPYEDIMKDIFEGRKIDA